MLQLLLQFSITFLSRLTCYMAEKSSTLQRMQHDANLLLDVSHSWFAETACQSQLRSMQHRHACVAMWGWGGKGEQVLTAQKAVCCKVVSLEGQRARAC